MSRIKPSSSDYDLIIDVCRSLIEVLKVLGGKADQIQMKVGEDLLDSLKVTVTL